MSKKLTAQQLEKLTIEIIEWLQKREMFEMICIYVNGKRYCDDKHPDDIIGKTKYGKYYITNNINPKEYIQFANPETITMSFEGPLYHMMNYGSHTEIEKFEKLFKKYGLWFEQGYAWSLSAYYD